MLITLHADLFDISAALWCLLFKTVSYPILEYTLLVELNDILRGFILP